MVIDFPANPSAEVDELADIPNNATFVPLSAKLIVCVKLIPFTVIVCVFVPLGTAVKLKVLALGDVKVGSVETVQPSQPPTVKAASNEPTRFVSVTVSSFFVPHKYSARQG